MTTCKNYRLEEKEKAKELRDAGATYREIAKHLNISSGTARRWLDPAARLKDNDYSNRRHEFIKKRKCETYHNKMADIDYRIKYCLSQSERKANRLDNTIKKCITKIDIIKKAFTGTCAICGIPEIQCSTKLHMDHNHITGEFRGFLCSKCNHFLGLANDDIEILSKAIDYLKEEK